MPEIAWGGAIFVATLGILTSSGRIYPVDAAGFINPLLMKRGNLGLHLTPDLHRTPDPHDDCPFHGHGRRMRCYGVQQQQRIERASRSCNRTAACEYLRSIECQLCERKSHCHVFLGGLDPGQAPLKTLVLMLRQT